MRNIVEEIFEKAHKISLSHRESTIDKHSLTQAYEERLRAYGITPLNDTEIYESVLAKYDQKYKFDP